jgi:hypothetical protein
MKCSLPKFALSHANEQGIVALLSEQKLGTGLIYRAFGYMFQEHLYQARPQF